MGFLKKGDRVVVDTHVVVRAAIQARDGETASEIAAVRRIIEICARLIHTKPLEKELAPHLKRAGFRPTQVPLLRELERAGKLKTANASAVQPLDEAARSAFEGPGHRGVRNDAPLYEAAIAGDRIVVTSDKNLLGRAKDLLARTGVRTIAPADVVRDDEEEPPPESP